jgi:Domain of unknown function (DUF5916)
VVRLHARSHEESATFVKPRGDRGLISRLGMLVGMDDLGRGGRLEILPYAAGRLVYRPEVEGVAEPRVLDPSADLGFDLKASLGRSFALQATVNPDFGQVEADQILQNLTTYELLFPEKRPFFTQGMDLFQPVKPWEEPSPPSSSSTRGASGSTPPSSERPSSPARSDRSSWAPSALS